MDHLYATFHLAPCVTLSLAVFLLHSTCLLPIGLPTATLASAVCQAPHGVSRFVHAFQQSCFTCHFMTRVTFLFARSRQQLTHVFAKLQKAAVPPMRKRHVAMSCFTSVITAALVQSLLATSPLPFCSPNQTLTRGRCLEAKY
ncbi:hypothetical protein Scep_002378 [Stephania cephalantha]|uniref:Uncharacterized protein n=1 Tax=Stephania cephalantha TaxID=152367 RepID=A0AAP0L9T9_9MAGN